jgi:hypothetical protein
MEEVCPVGLFHMAVSESWVTPPCPRSSQEASIVAQLIRILRVKREKQILMLMKWKPKAPEALSSWKQEVAPLDCLEASGS